MSKMLRTFAAATLSAVMAISLAGCEGQIPQPAASSTTDESSAGVKATPDLTEAQEKAIRKAILDAYQSAGDSKSTDGLDARVTGPALDIYSSRIAIAKASNSAVDKYATIPSEIAQTVIPTDSGWPRTVFSITTTTEDQQSKRLLVMVQESAQSNYKLWGMARLFQGTTLPSFAVPKIGASMGTATDSGLVTTPQDAVKQYADVLANGSNSQYAANVADDELRQNLATTTKQVADGMARNNGTQQQTFTPVDGAIYVMRSVDGGDLVVAQINSEWTRQAGEGRESQPASNDERALFGDGTATSTMKVSYVNTIALYVPAKDSGKQITAVGADRQVVKVEAL
ncbi:MULTISPECIES: hypothetical protein [Bifidobacterium]|uniref:hypothetical protein n=1 Tax=Bifidobacterium TaxID=1678 RepID=UPI001BDBC1C6|nr:MULTISPECIES: hypothetical protein [Bifidobacterium]MBT1161435.1 hypothetical protein [Bifidobacterium sp. SO1]MBW3078999.1 hypothetical protein [Bifidobacterium simiiventris]